MRRAMSSETLKPIPRGVGDFEVVYSLTGDMESDIARAVGQQIAVCGYVEVASSDGTKKVEDLPRFNVIGWHKVSDRCATPKSAPEEPAR
jgi:hypothetical protein